MRATDQPAVPRAAAACLAAELLVGSALPASADAGFQQLDRRFRGDGGQERRQPRQVYRAAFAGVSDPDPEVLEKARFQPEFQDKIWDYLDNRVHEESRREGQA